MSTPKSRKCWDCGKRKPLFQFYKHKNGKDGHSSQCGECNRKYRKAYWKKNRTKILEVNLAYRKKNRNKIRSQKLVAAYGITLAERNLILRKQKYRCAICRERGNLHVDHCHATHTIRGLLCMDCNTGLGKFKDSASVLDAALNYLKG